MDRKSIIIERESIHTFLSNISFNKSYYNLYNEIISQNIELDDNILIFLICQTAFQVGFDGYFDEFYIDVCKRPEIYVKQILSNLRTAYLSSETLSSKFYKYIFCIKMSNREILFKRILHNFNFDYHIESIFIEEDEELKTNFITVCNLILSKNQPKITNNRVVPVHFGKFK
jgi:hypothetical protein